MLNTTRSDIMMYTLAGIAVPIFPLVFAANPDFGPLLIPSMVMVLCVNLLLARSSLKHRHAAHSLSSQLEAMIEHRALQPVIAPSGSPEINSIGHQLNILIDTATHAHPLEQRHSR